MFNGCTAVHFAQCCSFPNPASCVFLWHAHFTNFFSIKQCLHQSISPSVFSPVQSHQFLSYSSHGNFLSLCSSQEPELDFPSWWSNWSSLWLVVGNAGVSENGWFYSFQECSFFLEFEDLHVNRIMWKKKSLLTLLRWDPSSSKYREFHSKLAMALYKFYMESLLFAQATTAANADSSRKLAVELYEKLLVLALAPFNSLDAHSFYLH